MFVKSNTSLSALRATLIITVIAKYYNERREVTMLNGLRTEMNKRGLLPKDIAPVIGSSLKSVYNKVNGLTEFTASEMLIIRKEFFPEFSLEYLLGDEADSYMNKTIALTEAQVAALSMYLLLSTEYREKEEAACKRLGAETGEGGALLYPNLKANGQWWEETNAIIKEILKIL